MQHTRTRELYNREVARTRETADKIVRDAREAHDELATVGSLASVVSLVGALIVH